MIKNKNIYKRPQLKKFGKVIHQTAGSGAGSGTDQRIYAKGNGSYD